MTHDESDKRATQVANMIPDDWDGKPLGLAHEIREYLKTVVDEGTEIDSGGSDGTGDLWATVGGVEYIINIKKSNFQLRREAEAESK